MTGRTVRRGASTTLSHGPTHVLGQDRAESPC
jgi:hypothetical protein